MPNKKSKGGVKYEIPPLNPDNWENDAFEGTVSPERAKNVKIAMFDYYKGTKASKEEVGEDWDEYQAWLKDNKD